MIELVNVLLNSGQSLAVLHFKPRQQLNLRDGTLQLYGFARTASELIGLLEQSSLFRTPQFRSPVTQDPRLGEERFHLSVDISQGDG